MEVRPRAAFRKGAVRGTSSPTGDSLRQQVQEAVREARARQKEARQDIMFAKAAYEERRTQAKESIARMQSNRRQRLDVVLEENASRREDRLGQLDERLAALRQRQLEVARLRREHLERIHEQAHR